MTTRIYVDVDGVLNALHPHGMSPEEIAEASGWKDWHSRRIAGYVITWSRELIDELNKIAERKDVEFVWLTTWRGMANTEISPNLLLKGEDWRFLTDGGEATGMLWGQPEGPWWKLNEIREDVRRDPVDNIIWIDDGLPLHPDALSWASERGVVTVAPSVKFGLTRSDLDGILEIVNVVEPV